MNEDDATALNAPSAAAAAATSDLSSQPKKQLALRTSSPAAARRQQARDLSSSIVSNLATARGRPSPQQRRGGPSLPEVTTQTAGGRLYTASERSTSPRATQGRSKTAHSISTDTIPEEEGKLHSARPGVSPSDEGFERFFSTFGNLFSKISPSLAFAALPLNPTAPSTLSEHPAPPPAKSTSPTRTRSSSRSTPAANVFDDPDLSALISRPALRALRDEAGFPLTHESFYVVPPSGGTVSYAGILQQRGGLPEDGPQIPSPILEVSSDEAGAADTTARVRGSQHSAGSQDEFVDARESFGPPSPRSTRNSANLKGKRPSARSAVATFGSRKTGEELEGENAALRQLLDTQSRVLEKQGKRLQMWEAQSQSQTAAAMAQSFMAGRVGTAAGGGAPFSAGAARRQPGLSKETSAAAAESAVPGGLSGEDAAAKIAELEARLAVEAASRQELEKSSTLR